MGSLKLDNLKTSANVETGYTYVDLDLDITQTSVPTKFTKQNINGKDIKVDYDIDAINNSLNNIFKTVPGERFLVPTFGCNLRKYLFEPVSKAIADRIGLEVVRAVELWEPRVIVDRVEVIGRPDAHEYEITIRITIIALKKQVAFNGILNQDTSLTVNNLTRVCPT